MKRNLLLIVGGLVLISMLYVGVELFVPTGSSIRSIEIEIPQGATFRQAAEILQSQNLIRDKNIFLLLGRLTGADRRIRAGYYSLWGTMRPIEIFRIIRQGRIIEYEVRVIEGDSLFEIGEAFEKVGITSRDTFLELARGRSLLTSHNIDAPSLEGYLFPDTYIIPKGVAAENAVGLMIARLREKVTSDMQKRAGELGMSENELLTLASIIEKEAVVDAERPLISAVYHNRLKKKIPLQADPTSIYGVKTSKEKITRDDIRRKTPYNTYVIKGLPPGPIASPGLKSIVAALNPAAVPYLFFVSNNDGTHQFSVTEAEHAAAVKAYRQKRLEMKTKAEEDGAT